MIVECWNNSPYCLSRLRDAGKMCCARLVTNSLCLRANTLLTYCEANRQVWHWNWSVWLQILCTDILSMHWTHVLLVLHFYCRSFVLWSWATSQDDIGKDTVQCCEVTFLCMLCGQVAQRLSQTSEAHRQATGGTKHVRVCCIMVFSDTFPYWILVSGFPCILESTWIFPPKFMALKVLENRTGAWKSLNFIPQVLESPWIHHQIKLHDHQLH